MAVVEVDNISKFYGAQAALDSISFKIDSCGLIGLLGPNGAGKSTLMKIMCAYIAPSTGSLKINGHDSTKDAMEIRRLIGYLPEQNPLYADMYVKEYLDFTAKLYKLNNIKARVSSVIEMLNFGNEQNKKVENLSKGYKQRLGLAQAILPDPEVLILDEPSTGLDPNQNEEIRKLLKELSQNKTIILSTHIMQEVEELCSRIILLNKGKLVLDSNLKDIDTQSNNLLRNKLEEIFHSL